MIKVSELIKELQQQYPGLLIRRTVRKICLPHYGYSRWARYITAHDACRVKIDIGAADFLNKLGEEWSRLGEENE